MTSAAQPPVSFEAHVELLRSFLTRREKIVERLEELLSSQRKAPQYLEDAPLLARHFEGCFFALGDDLHLRPQLDEAHRASGFKPRETRGQPNDLIDAAEITSRAFRMWQHGRWPGRLDRERYAHTLFNVYLLRRLMLLAMRIWDAGSPGERLAQVQGLLDELVRTTPAGRPLFVRDARWLFPLAQSPTTDELHGYLEVAERIATTLSEQDRLETNNASVRMAGGHLRSQLRHVSTQKAVSLDDPLLVLSTRKSNALDLATLIQGLVPLLAAYEQAVETGNAQQRVELADALCQGISPDPELFVNRLDLLRPYSMIEYLFIATDADGQAAYTPMGERHVRLVDEYAALIGRVSKPLHDDCRRFRPTAGSYSPYGALYGFSSQLLEHIALKALTPGDATRFSLEDVFTGGDADKLAWVSGWRKLPHVPREVQKLFDYPQPFAEGVFARVERALHERVSAETSAAARDGRLFVLAEHAEPSPAPGLAVHYVVSSDRQVVAHQKAVPSDEWQLLHGRTEGEHLVSYQTPGGWVALSKDVLTDVLGAGRDATIEGLPRAAARVLKLMCPDLVVLLP